MPKTPIPFLQLIQDKAIENKCIAIDLPDQQGIVVPKQGTSTQKHIDLLRKVILDLGPTQISSTHQNPGPEKTALDCQVTVEERTQLFNFLHSPS